MGPATVRKIWGLLGPAQRRTALGLLLLTFVGMVLETLGIGMVVPVIALLTQPDYAARAPVVQRVLAFFGNPSENALVIGAMLSLAGAFLVKNTFLAFVTWRQMRFAFDLQAQLSQRLFAAYLYQAYTFHLQRNSAQLLRNATTDVMLFATHAMVPGMFLLTEALVLVGLFALLFVVEPVGALMVVSVLASAAWAFHHFTRKRLTQWGIDRQHHEGLRIQHLQQGLGGAKEIKLLGRETEFLRQYERHNLLSARMGRLQSTLYHLPRLWLELLAVVGLVALVLAIVTRGRPLAAVLPTLALFSAAAFRLLPSANRAIASMQSLRYGLPVIDMLDTELRLATATAPQRRSTRASVAHAIELERVRFTYPGAAQPALDDLSVVIRRGETVGFIGTSGAGKSTLVDVLLGLLAPDAGTVRVDGADVQTNLRAWQDQIGYVPQTIYMTDDTLRRNIAFGLPDESIDEELVWRSTRAAQLEDFVQSLPQGLDTVIGERGVRLSGGQRQRIGIARALYHDPAVLVLDEATSSLDTATERGVMQAVRALHGSKTIVIVAHRLSTVEHCDRLYRIERGRVAQEGVPSALLMQHASGEPTVAAAGGE
jgi:ABC-type multidrug transport system fused ATPase/permease subunit